MKATGKRIRWALLMAALLLSASVRAELIASVERERIAMGDTLRLTITATENEAINNIDMRPLLADFDILQRSNSSSTNIINGQKTSTRQVHLDLTPKREGSVRIPSLRVGGDQTNYLLIAVGPAATASGDPLVSFEAELDTGRVYVQGQAIVTLRVQQAINLDARSVNEFQLENAFIKPLEQKSYQRTIDGRPWLVHEIRYAIFPEKSGPLIIPAQTFTARESAPRRSMFDLGNSGRQLKRVSEPLTLTVLPRPDTYPDDTWLPARNLTISEQWSTAPDQLRVGESTTRQIIIEGEGLQGAQLPPTLFPATEGLKYYPDQPTIADTETGTGLLGTRLDSAALVPVRDGQWQIPELRIPWWDITAGKVRYAVLPARTITVAASLNPAQITPVTPLPGAATGVVTGFDASPIATMSNEQRAGWWPPLALFLATGWGLTLAWLWFSRRKPVADIKAHAPNPSESAALKSLLAACATNNAAQTRTYLVAWAAASVPAKPVHSLEQVQHAFNDDELTGLLKDLNATLYGFSDANWNGKNLALTIKRLRSKLRQAAGATEDELTLYPQQA